jgi:multiple sugar transport system substrate-binding protein
MVLALFLGGFGFAGGQGEAPAGGGSDQEAEQVVVRMSSWLATEGASRDTLMEMIGRFEEANPGITVELINIPYAQTQQQVLVAATGGNAPDVMQLNPVFSMPLAAQGALTDLSGYFGEDELNDIPEAAYEAGLYEGSLVTVPWQLAPIVVFGHKALLEQAGLPAEIPATWPEFKDAVERISALGDDIYGFGARTAKSGNSAFWWFPVLWGHGGQFQNSQGDIVLDSPNSVDALEWYRVLGQNEYSPRGMGIPEVRNLFGQGKVAFIFDGPWMRGILRDMTGMGEDFDDEYVVGEFPEAPDGNRYAIANNHVLGVAEQSRVKEEAVKLVKFLTQEPQIANYYYDQMAAIPVYGSILDNDRYQDAYAQVFIESASYANPVPSKNPSFNQALEFMAADLQAALLGASPEEAADRMADNVRTLYGQ